MNVRELLNELGLNSGDHDQDVRAALRELRATRTELRDALESLHSEFCGGAFETCDYCQGVLRKVKNDRF